FGQVVWTAPFLDAIEAEGMPAELDLLARRQREFALLAQAFDQQRAGQEYRDAEMRQHHAEHLRGHAPAGAAQALPGEAQGAEPDPRRAGDTGGDLPFPARR